MLAMQRTTWTLASSLRPHAHTKRCLGKAAASRGASTLEQNGIAVTVRREREARGRRAPSLERSLWKPWAKSDRGVERDAISSLFNKGNDLSRHRPATVTDVKAMKRVRSKGKPTTNLTIEEIEDLGLRVQPEICSEMQEQLILMEVESLIEQYGFSHVGEYTMLHSADQDGKILDTKNHVNTMRVTGRPEADYPTAPWGYGDDFNIDAVPEQLRFVLDQIAESPLWAVGKPRDITINKRENGFFKLDPHTDPVTDGENVFIVNLLSNSVLTFVPPGDFDRTHPHQISLQSWTDDDVDVLMMRRAMVLFSGKSRMPWKHALRTGVQIELENGEMANCDWWGEARNLVRRSPTRMSIVLAFGDPVPKMDEYTQAMKPVNREKKAGI